MFVLVPYKIVCEIKFSTALNLTAPRCVITPSIGAFVKFSVRSIITPRRCALKSGATQGKTNIHKSKARFDFQPPQGTRRWRRPKFLLHSRKPREMNVVSL